MAALVRVASVPSDHVYVRHLGRPDGTDDVVRLPDPVPDTADVQPGQWWPPAMLDERWIKEHHDEFDVFHVHFGFDAESAEHLSGVLDALDEYGKPLVYTVHDLRNPHHADPHAHDEHLDVLIPRADALITLTPGAAHHIAARWGRSAHVIPHPHVVEPDRMRVSRRRTRDERFVIGVHAKSVRPSMDPRAAIEALLPLVDELPGAQLVVDVHHDVYDTCGLRHDPQLRELLARESSRGRLALAVHDCYTDEELWDYFESLDVSVLAYRFGTHSGWLEACYDLGTTVVASNCGFYAEQRPCLLFDMSDGESLRSAVRQAHAQRPHWQASIAQRMHERDEIAAAHRDIYASVLR